MIPHPLKIEALLSFETSGSLNPALQRNTPGKQNPEIDVKTNLLTYSMQQSVS
jgi:hypothetical protein